MKKPKKKTLILNELREKVENNDEHSLIELFRNLDRNNKDLCNANVDKLWSYCTSAIHQYRRDVVDNYVKFDLFSKIAPEIKEIIDDYLVKKHFRFNFRYPRYYTFVSLLCAENKLWKTIDKNKEEICSFLSYDNKYDLLREIIHHYSEDEKISIIRRILVDSICYYIITCECVKIFIEELDIETIFRNNNTLLGHFVLYGGGKRCSEIIRLLLDNGADVDAKLFLCDHKETTIIDLVDKVAHLGELFSECRQPIKSAAKRC